MAKGNDELFLDAIEISSPKNLSSFVTDFEAKLFHELLLSGQRDTENLFSIAENGLKETLLPDITAVLGDGVDIRVHESSGKGSFWLGCEINALIDTGKREVTRKEQKELTERLSKNNTLCGVKLSCVAIHFSFLSTNVDLVFSNLVGVGKLPLALGMDNPIVELAALALKVAVNERQQQRVANFLLEMMVARTFQHLMNSFKNAFELFVTVSQAIVDTNGEVLLSSLMFSSNPKKSLSRDTLTKAAKRLSQLLHVFCLSRFFLSGEEFSRIEQIEQWLRQTKGTDFPAPQIPGWMFGISPPPESSERLLCNEQKFSQNRPSPSPMDPIEIWGKCHSTFTQRSYQHFLESPRRQYIHLPQEDPVPSPKPSIDELIELGCMGSKVASQMLLTRSTWYEGDKKLEEGDIHRAIDLWYESICLSCTGVDPFCGRHPPGWEDSIRNYFLSNRDDPKVAIVLVYCFLLDRQDWKGAKQLLQPFLQSHPNHPGILFTLMDVEGNRQDTDWNLVDRLVSRLIELEPDQPIWVYWKAVQRQSVLNFPEAIACYKEWLSRASLEGRKVPIAYKNLALCQFVKRKMCPSAREQFIETYEKGLEAEEKVLPFFRTDEPVPLADEFYSSFAGERGKKYPSRLISPHHFELRSLRNEFLGLCSKVDRPPKKRISKPFTTPPRTNSNRKLIHTAIKKAWKKTEERSAGRVLVGTISLPPILCSSAVMTILMDDEGDAIFLALYNFPGVQEGTSREVLQQILPVGSRVTIREPFLHTFAGISAGRVGIQVDDPSDMKVDVSYSPKACYWCWKKEGAVKLKKCGGCRMKALYCGRNCQTEDWKLHKLFH